MNLNWKANDLKKLCIAQFLTAILIIVLATFYYGMDGFGPQDRMFFSSGFEDFDLYKNLNGREIATIIFFWLFKVLAVVMGILQMLVVNTDAKSTSVKNGYAIPAGVLACISFIVMVTFVGLIFQVLCFNRYAAQLDDINNQQ